MRTIYLRKDSADFTRKVTIDMAYLVTHKKIRLPKYIFEEGLYLPFKDGKQEGNSFEKYNLTKDKIVSEDGNFYYFNFPFKAEQVEGPAS